MKTNDARMKLTCAPHSQWIEEKNKKGFAKLGAKKEDEKLNALAACAEALVEVEVYDDEKWNEELADVLKLAAV